MIFGTVSEYSATMPTKPLDRLMFTQGGLCFFCREPLLQSEASVEHLVASANGGGNGDDNCVACCKALNALFGSMSLKEKIQLVLNQKGHFKCPNKAGAPKAAVSDAVVRASFPQTSKSLSEKVAWIIADLQKRGSARPRTIQTLSSTISALFQKQVSEQEVSSLIERLRTDGVIAVAGAKLSYDLPIKVA
jgi:hypothetical protein